VPAYLQKLGSELQRRLSDAACTTHLKVQGGGLHVQPSLQFQTDDPVLKTKLATSYIQEMTKGGCHRYMSFYLNAAQGTAEIE